MAAPATTLAWQPLITCMPTSMPVRLCTAPKATVVSRQPQLQVTTVPSLTQYAVQAQVCPTTGRLGPPQLLHTASLSPFRPTSSWTVQPLTPSCSPGPAFSQLRQQPQMYNQTLSREAMQRTQRPVEVELFRPRGVEQRVQEHPKQPELRGIAAAIQVCPTPGPSGGQRLVLPATSTRASAPQPSAPCPLERPQAVEVEVVKWGNAETHAPCSETATAARAGS